MIAMLIELQRQLGVAVGMVFAMGLPAASDGCTRMDQDGQTYVVCQIDAARESDLRLWQNDADGRPLNSFNNVRKSLPQGQSLSFAMNAGMFHPDYRPVGLLVIDGQELHPITTQAGGGNFGMLPKGHGGGLYGCTHYGYIISPQGGPGTPRAAGRSTAVTACEGAFLWRPARARRRRLRGTPRQPAGA